MTIDALWHRYSAIWSKSEDERAVELDACLAPEASYCDPNGRINGRAALSAYMGGFQESVPGGRFEIRSVLHHAGGSLADWALIGPDGGVKQTGTSFATLSEQGQLLSINGFFRPMETRIAP